MSFRDMLSFLAESRVRAVFFAPPYPWSDAASALNRHRCLGLSHVAMPASPNRTSLLSWTWRLVWLIGAIVFFFLGRLSVQHSSAPAVASGAPPMVAARASSSAIPDIRAAPPTAASVDEWRRKLDLTPPSPAQEKDRLQLLAAWARVAPADALDYVRKTSPLDRQPEAITTIFEAWAQHDPKAAWDWVVTRENGEAGRLHTVLSEVAKNDSKLAESFAQVYAAQHPDLASNAYFSVVDGVVFKGGYAAAQAIVANASVPNDEQRSLLVNYLAGDWARYQPDAAAQWVLHLPDGPTRTQALNAVTQAWSDANPAQAAAFAVNLPAGAERRAALEQAVSKWTMVDPVQAGEWVLKNNANGDFDQAVAAIATSSELMNHKVSLALDWAGTIQQPELRMRSTTAIVTTWYSADPASALKYINTSPDLSPNQRDQLLHALPAHN